MRNTSGEPGAWITTARIGRVSHKRRHGSHVLVATTTTATPIRCDTFVDSLPRLPPLATVSFSPRNSTRSGDGRDAFVAEHHGLGVERIRRAFDVASSTFYGWLAQRPSEHEQLDRPLPTAITEILAGGDGKAAAYVSPRVHETL